ncbi:MAG: succinate dehydrogenase assembly factor 2 [Gammaproteobacteria bacterium]|nr:succinate dehydrogenase assembly factor 2 [Gammaproteobacteria bacterium]
MNASENENQAELKALLWATRRGMLELDVILTPYLQQEFAQMTASEIEHFKAFLGQDDPDLYAWLMGFEAPKPEFAALSGKIRNYIQQQLN